MSYCKFENTLGALRECEDGFDMHLSEREFTARRELVELMREMADRYEDQEFAKTCTECGGEGHTYDDEGEEHDYQKCEGEGYYREGME